MDTRYIITLKMVCQHKFVIEIYLSLMRYTNPLQSAFDQTNPTYAVLFVHPPYLRLN